jgi:hypothetical protein
MECRCSMCGHLQRDCDQRLTNCETVPEVQGDPKLSQSRRDIVRKFQVFIFKARFLWGRKHVTVR